MKRKTNKTKEEAWSQTAHAPDGEQPGPEASDTSGQSVPKCQPPWTPVQSQPQKQSPRARQPRLRVPYAFGPPGVVYSVFASFFISSGRVVKRS